MYCEEVGSDITKYVKRDLSILCNYEFAHDEYGYQINNDDKIAKKLFIIANKYPQKHLWAILTHFGYFTGEEELKEENYRDEIRYLAEDYFKQAMNDIFLMYDGGCDGNIKKQVFFIEQGLIGGWFASRNEWREKLKQYKDKYPQKSVDI